MLGVKAFEKPLHGVKAAIREERHPRTRGCAGRSRLLAELKRTVGWAVRTEPSSNGAVTTATGMPVPLIRVYRRRGRLAV